MINLRHAVEDFRDAFLPRRFTPEEKALLRKGEDDYQRAVINYQIKLEEINNPGVVKSCVRWAQEQVFKGDE